MGELSLESLANRGVSEQARMVRAWRRAQRRPSGRRLRIADLAALVGVKPETLGAFERGKRPSRRLAVRLFAVMAAMEGGGWARMALGSSSAPGDRQLELFERKSA